MPYDGNRDWWRKKLAWFELDDKYIQIFIMRDSLQENQFLHHSYGKHFGNEHPVFYLF